MLHLVHLVSLATFLENEHGHPPPPWFPVLSLSRQEVQHLAADWLCAHTRTQNRNDGLIGDTHTHKLWMAAGAQ